MSELKDLEKFKDWVRAGLRVHPDHALELAERVQAAEAKLARVRELHPEAIVYEYDTMKSAFVTGENGEQIVMARLCGTCTAAGIIEDIGDCSYDGPGLFDETPYPCPTIRALDGAQ